MVWQENPHTIPLMAAAAVSLLMVVYVWRIRGAPGARTGAGLLLASAEWTVCYALELASADLPSKLLWCRWEYLGITTIPVSLFFFAMRYSGRDSWLTVRNRVLFMAVPLITIAMAFTNERHGLVWSRIELNRDWAFALLDVEHGLWFWIHTLYSYSLVLLATLIFLQMLLRSRNLYRWQATAFVVGSLIPWGANVVYLMRIVPPPHVDLTPLGFTLGSLVLAWTLTRLRTGDIVSVSRDTIIEGMGDGVIVLDPDDRVVDLNPAAQGMIGHPLPEVVGHSLEEVWQGWPAQEGLSDGPEAPARELLSAGSGGQRAYDLRMSALSDWRGRLVSRVVVLRDITERKQMERALQESEARFRRLAENAQDIIYRYELSPRRGFTYVSPSATSITGYTIEEHYEDPDFVSRLLLPEDRHLANLSHEQYCAGPVTVRWRRKEGRIVWVELRNVAIPDGDGKVVAIEGVIRDVTERQLLEAQLLRAQRLETAGRIAGQVAHDFNNLLGPLVAYPELIKMRLPEGHLVTPFCDAMQEAAERMADINEDMLALGRRGHFDEQPVDLNGLTADATSSIAGGSAAVGVDLQLAPDLLPALGSPAQLSRVLSNLVSNAREAMQDMGILTVRTENVYVDEPFGRYNRVQMGEYVRLTVSDTGCGIPSEIRDKIFDAFFTTKQGNKRRGCGLGLSVVQAIVEDHHGYLDLESEVGKGTTFSVYLPVARGALPEIPDQQMEGGGESILVVDDDALQRQVVRELLRRLGYRVEAATSGEEALSRLQEHPVDLVILDMVMPGGMDGAETYRQMLKLLPGLPAIVLSGFAESKMVENARKLGAGRYLRKPVTLEKLARAVRDELGREHGAVADSGGK